MPIIQRVGSPLKFFYEPGMIAIYIENSSMTRFIKLNAEHSARPNPTFLGESVGHFEGDTLVVDSVGFDDILLQYGDLPGQGNRTFRPAAGGDIWSAWTQSAHGRTHSVGRSGHAGRQLTIYDDTVWKDPTSRTRGRFSSATAARTAGPTNGCAARPTHSLSIPSQDKTIEEDPAEVLKRLQQQDKH